MHAEIQTYSNHFNCIQLNIFSPDNQSKRELQVYWTEFGVTFNVS